MNCSSIKLGVLLLLLRAGEGTSPSAIRRLPDLIVKIHEGEGISTLGREIIDTGAANPA
jgi:hypothetical protein